MNTVNAYTNHEISEIACKAVEKERKECIEIIGRIINDIDNDVWNMTAKAILSAIKARHVSSTSQTHYFSV